MDSSSAEEDADDGSEPDSTSEFTEENPALTELKAEDNQEGYEEQSQEDSSFYGTDESYGGDDAASSEGTEDGSSSGELQLTTVSDDSYVQSMYEAYVEAQNAAMHPDSEEDAYAKADEAKRAYQAYLDAANGVSSSGTDSGSSEDYTEDSSSYDSGSSEESGSDSGSGSESGYSESSSSYDSGSTNASGYSDLDLLAGIIWCEAGNQPYEGMVAVGEVVMNRVASGAFPNTIEGVLSQPGQFTPYSSGGLQSALANGVNSSCYAAAQDALNGVSPVPGALYFNTASGTTKLGDHYFS